MSGAGAAPVPAEDHPEDDPAFRFYAALEARDWAAVEAVLAPEVVYELLQSRERVRGRGDYLRFNQDYPGDWHLTVRRLLGEGQQRAVWLEVRLEDEVMDNLAWLTLDDDARISSVVDFWPEPSEPAPHRPTYVERW